MHLCMSQLIEHSDVMNLNINRTMGAQNVTGPAKIDHVSANYTELYFC